MVRALAMVRSARLSWRASSLRPDRPRAAASNRALIASSSAWAYQTSSAVLSANPLIDLRYAATAASTMPWRCLVE